VAVAQLETLGGEKLARDFSGGLSGGEVQVFGFSAAEDSGRLEWEAKPEGCAKRKVLANRKAS
jgi:hypothetical protein